MSFFRNVFHLLLFVLNVLCSIGFLVCAYSPYISPVRHPIWACAGLAFPLLACALLVFMILWIFIRRIWALFPLATLLLGWGSLTTYLSIGGTHSASEESIKVLTYNVEGFPPAKGEKVHPILSYLKKSGADVICMQEFQADGNVSSREIRKALSDYPYYRHTQLGGGNQVACYSRFPILSAKKIDYESSFNGSVCYRLKWGKDTLMVINNHLESNKLDTYDRALYRELLHSSDNQEIKESSTHLLHKLADAVAIRGPQADSVAEVIARSRNPYMVVCGDFNDSPISYAHHTIGRELTDAFVEAGKGLGISYNQGRFYFRIDHIFVGKGFIPKQCVVDRSIRISDHYPVWCIMDRAKKAD